MIRGVFLKPGKDLTPQLLGLPLQQGHFNEHETPKG